MKKKHILFSFLLVMATLLAGCENTISGFGKDMQSAGQKIEKSAN